MKKPLLYFIFSILLFSCSSKKKKVSVKKVEKKDDYFISTKVKKIKKFNPFSLKNLNFKKYKNKIYEKENDYYKHSIANSNIVGKESLDLYTYSEKMKTLREIKEPIAVAANYCYLNRIEQGLDVLDKIYFSYKSQSSYWNQMAICYYLKGDYRKADIYFNKSLSLNKNFVPSINNLGVLYNKRKFYQRAFETFNKSSKTNSFSVTPILNKAQLLLKFNLYQAACPIFETLHKEDSFNKDIGHGLGTCYLLKGEYSKSLAIYRDLKINLKDDEIPYVHYLVALKLMGRYNEIKTLISNVKANFRSKYARRVFDFARSR